LPDPNPLPNPIRLLLIVLLIRWVLSKVSLPLLARQAWSMIATIIAIIASVWLFMLFSQKGEAFFRRQLQRRAQTGAASILRLTRWVGDLLALFVGLLVGLHQFGVSPTAALAGLGVGGIAVALAAQKTLENVIAGVSLIFDQAVRVGDTLKVGDTLGTVDEIGLRSTRIRTLDRTMVNVPNSQIASMSLETLSARDKFWFHPMIGLRYETTPEQLRAVVEGIHKLLAEHPSIDYGSLRVRFLCLGASSLDVEVFAYVFARDWSHFLELQEHLLLRVMEIIAAAGAQIAFPSQTLYMAGEFTPDRDGGKASKSRQKN
jgi:MscS family membrane protein